MRPFVLLFLLIALPALAQPRPTGRAAELEALAAGLQAAPSEEAAARIEGRMRELWAQAISPSALLLIKRGMRELANAAPQEALDDIEAALVLDPEAPDAYLRRGLVRSELGDYPGALADIQETLRREPRHFPAWQSLSRIAETREDFAGAIAAWKKVLELSPKTPEGEERLKALTKKLLGEDA